ncbi:hypothetical protein [Siphonobacter sp.]|uniref:hypothetical protein n=1 Tax=Siphonobacter sp. TaxID=1869184 RepID=UPI003B3A144F
MLRTCLLSLLLLSKLGSLWAQSIDQTYKSHITLRLTNGQSVQLEFNQFSDLLAHRNLDSVLHLFVTDYQKVRDTSEALTAHTIRFRFDENRRQLDVRSYPQTQQAYHFSGTEEPALLKTQSDTLELPAWQAPAAVGWGSGSPQFWVRFILNDLSFIETQLKKGGFNPFLEEAIQSVYQYKNHHLTSSKVTFDLVQEGKKATFSQLNFVRAAFISFQPRAEVGVIRHRLVPALAADVMWVPDSYRGMGFSVGLQSHFFFRGTPETGFHTDRNDFLNLGVHFYSRRPNGQKAEFSKLLTHLSVGVPIRRVGGYFPKNTVRLSGTVFSRGFIKLEPELYMTGFFRNVYPGVRLRLGL